MSSQFCEQNYLVKSPTKLSETKSFWSDMSLSLTLIYFLFKTRKIWKGNSGSDSPFASGSRVFWRILWDLKIKVDENLIPKSPPLKVWAVKWVGGPRIDSFNRENFKVRALVFPGRLNPIFFGPNWASPRLTGGPNLFFLIFSFLLIMKNTFNFNTNHDFFTSFLRNFFFFHFYIKKIVNE